MYRRKMLVATTVMGVGSFLQTATSHPVSVAGELSCYAPDDVSIEEIYVTNGSVTIGQKLLKIHSLKLLQFQAKLAFYREMLAISERPFKDQRLDELLAVLKQQAENALDVSKKRNTILSNIEDHHRLGFTLLDPLLEAQIAASKANALYVALSIELAHYPNKVADIMRRMNAASQLLEKEELLLKRDEERMTLRAPEDGIFVMEVGLNGFVKRGGRLGKILVTRTTKSPTISRRG